MRLVVTGAAGFVGSNVVHEALAAGHEVVGLVRSRPPVPAQGCEYVEVDLLDPEATRAAIGVARPEAIVHTAIWNDPARLLEEPERAWDSYVGVARTLAGVANDAGALLVTVSTDWVFDGRTGGYAEDAPPSPVNTYGRLKAASEAMTLERAKRGAVARIAGVMGTHRARPELPRGQDAGFGYFVASLIDALGRGEPFAVWESDAINMRATPSLASHSARLILRVCERAAPGVFHCVGGEPAGRMELARAAAEVFELDTSLLRFGPPDPSAVPAEPVPRDTSLLVEATEDALGVRLLGVRELLEAFREERAADGRWPLQRPGDVSRMAAMTETGVDIRLAIDGGSPARTRPEWPMYPGGMEIDEAEVEAVTRVLRSKNVFRYYGVGDGPHEVELFEREFAGHVGSKHALCVNAGSSALICGLIGAGVQPGDEVIVPAYTWNATTNAVLAARAAPVLAEVDDSLTLDPEDVLAKITPRTKAILPVHMRGAPAHMDALGQVAREHGLVVVEDVCQAAGATFRGKRLGTFGDAGAFSLQFNKIITTGEGGVLITDRDDVYDLAIDVHDCAGSVRRGIGLPKFAGWNFRASELQGAVARVQLGRLDGLLERMRANQQWLAERIRDLPGLTLRRANDEGGDAGICLIAFAETPELAGRAAEALRAEGVLASVVYSPDVIDLHVYPYWKPVLEAIAEAGLPVPDCPRTLDLTGRAIHVDVSPLNEPSDLEEIATAFEKVARGTLA